jgi:drug/metabolite transporter (DMT)-like permease
VGSAVADLVGGHVQIMFAPPQAVLQHVKSGALRALAVTGGARMPSGLDLAHLAGGVVFGMSGYHALTYAMRTGEVGAVTPFRYTRLIFAMVLAMLLFGERPDLATWIGAGLVVGSGLFALTRK